MANIADLAMIQSDIKACGEWVRRNIQPYETLESYGYAFVNVMEHRHEFRATVAAQDSDKCEACGKSHLKHDEIGQCL